MSDELAGRYVLSADGMVVPDDNAKAIWRRVQDMLLLLGPGRVPYFYVDPTDGTYWEFVEYEDDQITLRRVTREYIETNWPSVDFDRPVVVDRPIRY